MAEWKNFIDGHPPKRGWYLWRWRGKLHVIFIYQSPDVLPQLLAFQVGIETWTPLHEMYGQWLGPIDLKEVETLALKH